MNNLIFFGVSNHSLTVVGCDGAYTKPLTSHYIIISLGQTLDLLLKANQPKNRYYLAAKLFNGQPASPFDNTTTTAIFEYTGKYIPSSPPLFPILPAFNDTTSAANFTGNLLSLATPEHPIDVPMTIKKTLFYTLSINAIPCASNETCQGPGNTSRFAASINNITFDMPSTGLIIGE